MTKRQIIKFLRSEFTTKKKYNRSHDIIIIIDDIEYCTKILSTTSNMQVTLNSKTIWELSKGKISGLKFKKTSSMFVDLRKFMENETKVIILTDEPYRILKYINESEVVDISTNPKEYDTFICKNVKKLTKTV